MTATAYFRCIYFHVNKWCSLYISNYWESHPTLPWGSHVPSTDHSEGRAAPRDLTLSLVYPGAIRKPPLTTVIGLAWRAIKKVTETKRKWWSQFSHKPRIMWPEFLPPPQTYSANAIKCWSKGIASLTGWEIISLSLLKWSNLKPPIMLNVI